MSDGAIVLTFIGGVLALVALIVTIGMTTTYYVEKNQCHSFGQQSNREVKFVKYTLVTWDCLTPTADGKWISTSNLREFGEQP
jgi:hypothetical protein